MMTNEFFCSTNGQVAKTRARHEGRAAGDNLSPQASARGELLGPQRFPRIERIPFFKGRNNISPGPQNVALP